jgi:hypothetical protein
MLIAQAGPLPWRICRLWKINPRFRGSIFRKGINLRVISNAQRLAAVHIRDIFIITDGGASAGAGDALNKLNNAEDYRFATISHMPAAGRGRVPGRPPDLGRAH